MEDAVVLAKAPRDAVLKVVFRFLVTEKSLVWMYDYRVDWARAIDLPARAA